MSEPHDKPVTPSDLESVNRELATLLQTERVQLASGADFALEDELVVCGILGGKDVGKSTLINALAKAEVSTDTAEVGKGTERPMVYVHEAVREVATCRLGMIDRHVSFDMTPHTAEPIRNVVLVDLPDFDSEFLDHLHQVRAVAPLLDRIVWVVTPRKIGDRAWVGMFEDVIKDPGNVFCVLNKVDELLTDGDPFERDSSAGANRDGQRAAAFWQDQQRWVARVIESAGLSQAYDHRFLVAAAYPEPEAFVRRTAELWDDVDWAEYSVDQEAVAQVARCATGELNRLRARLLSPVTADEQHSIKTANRGRELQVNAARIKRHYDLDRTLERFAQVCDPDYQQQVLNEAMGAGYCGAVAEALRARLRHDTELADEILERRVEHWPLLRLAYWPFGWLSRIVGRRVIRPALTDSGRPATPATAFRPSPNPSDPFDVSGSSLVDRIGLMRSRILADHAVIARRLEMEPELPEAERLVDRVESAAQTLVPQFETRLIEEIRAGDRPPGILAKGVLWLILLWFPLLQPILAGGLEMFAEPGAFDVARGLLKIVLALSAAHLLAGFAVVVGVYVAMLAGMYARALRSVRRLQSEQAKASPIVSAVDELLVVEVVIPLVKPFQERLERLVPLVARVDQLTG